MKTFVKLCLVYAIIFPIAASAVGLHQISAPLGKSTSANTLNKYSPSIIKDAEVRLRRVEDGTDTAAIRFKFDGILSYGEKRRGFKELQKAGKLSEDIFRSEHVADYYMKLVSYHFDTRQLSVREDFIKQLNKLVATLKQSPEADYQRVKLEEDRKTILAGIDSLRASLTDQKTEFLSAYDMKIEEIDFKNLLPIDEVRRLIRDSEARSPKTLMERHLSSQLATNKIQRDLKLNSDDASITFIEVRRSLPDDGLNPQHSVAVGVNIPFIGDETGMMSDEASYLEKKYKILREINEHRVEFGQLKSLTLSNIALLTDRKARQRQDTQLLKKRAVQNLSVVEYAQAKSYDFTRTDDDLTMEKEVYLGFINIIKENGVILDYRNLLVASRANL